MKGTSGLLLAILVFFGFGCMCSDTGNQPSLTPPPPASAPITTDSAFAPSVVCLLPRMVAPRTLFAALGDGVWEKWDDSSHADYGCERGKDHIILLENDNGRIDVEYGVIGDREVVHYVSVEYSATQYVKQTPDEKRLRQEYADFCDKLSEKFYGMKLPATFRKRLLDESTYSSSGTANEYAEKVGDGFVDLSSIRNGVKMVMLDVHFFSSETAYKLYKDE